MKRRILNSIYLAVIFVAVLFCVLYVNYKSKKDQNLSYVTAVNTTSEKSDTEMYEDYIKESKGISTSTLKTNILNGVEYLKKDNDKTLNIKISAYLEEYVLRAPKDKDIENISSTLLDLFGPCWGIPLGQCRE